MKVIAYGIQPSDKAILALANHKKHDITLISNPLSAETAFYAQGKEAVLVFIKADVLAPVLTILVKMGISYLILCSESPCCVTLSPDGSQRIVWANVLLTPSDEGVFSLEASKRAAHQIIMCLDAWHLG